MFDYLNLHTMTFLIVFSYKTVQQAAYAAVAHCSDGKISHVKIM